MMDSSSSSSPCALDYRRLAGFLQFPPNYTLVTLLGRGGFGDVLKCIKEDTKEVVAVKVPQMGCCLKNELALLNFFMENKMDKFNIVKLIDSFPLRHDRAALAFEMLDITLRDYLFNVRDFAPMDLRDVRSVVQQMATALNALNSIHLIHSDIKLDNIMLVDQRARPLRIKLIDFGLAFPTSSVNQGDIHQTAYYRAPEIILGLPFAESIDMWSLGIVMGYMLLGDALFPGNTEYDVVRCIVDLLGVPPDHLLSAGNYAKKYFVKKRFGNWKLKTAFEYWGARVPPDDYRAYDFRRLDDVENLPLENLNMVEPDEKKECIDLLKAILEMDPNWRITPSQVLVHPFITRGTPDQSFDTETLESSTSDTARPGTSKTADSETTQASEADDSSTTETLGGGLTLPPGFVLEKPRHFTCKLPRESDGDSEWESDGESGWMSDWESDRDTVCESCSSYRTFTVGSSSPAASVDYLQTHSSPSDGHVGFYRSESVTFIQHPRVIVVQPAPPECILPLDEDDRQQSEACPLDSHKDFSEKSPEVFPGDVTSNPAAPPLPEDHNMEQERAELTDAASNSSCLPTPAPELLVKMKNRFRRAFSWMKKRFCSCISGGRKSGLFSPSTASLPAFSSLAPAEEDRDLTLRPSCTLGPDTDSTSTTVLARCSATQDIRQRCSAPGLPAEDAVTAEKRKVAVSSPKRETPLSPEWSTLRKKPEDSRADFHGLPPTPQVHMGACFSKVFNGCPLKINCAVTWILPKTKDQYLILGAEEGIYTLNLNELHEDTLEKLIPQRCTWLYVMNNVLMSVSGKSSQLYSHNLTALFEQKGHLQKKHSSLSLSTNRFTERISPRKFAISVKIPDTKGCRRCSVARNPYTDSTFLCGAVPSGLVLLLWYEPLQKFMHLKHIPIRLPDPLPVFELLVLVTDEFPQLCVGVRDCSNGKQPISQPLKFDIIELNSTPISAPDSGALTAVQVTQLDRDTVLIVLEKTVKIVNLRGLPSKELAAEMVFDFPIETLVCLQDSVLAFWKHGLKGKSFHSNEVTQEITDESRVFRVLGTNRDIILQSTPTDDPSALSNLYILTGHESSY